MKDAIELVDKPPGFSSYQIVRIYKRRYEKVGHAGTLDPLATGLLVILIGRSTKEFLHFQSLDKEYQGEFILGYSTDTYDMAGKVIRHADRCDHFTIEELRDYAHAHTGRIAQAVPPYSALKQRGQRFYQLSRRGEPVPARKRAVNIKSFAITSYCHPLVAFSAVVGKGTYIRSIVHEMGEELGCGAVLIGLRRMRIGSYCVSQARRLGDLLIDGKDHEDNY